MHASVCGNITIGDAWRKEIESVVCRMPSEAELIALSSSELGDTLPEILQTTRLSAITNRFDSHSDTALLN